MISFRQLLVIALVIGLIWLFHQLRQRLRQPPARPDETPATASFQDTVRCSRCGVHLIRSEARGNERHGYVCGDRDCVEQQRRSKSSTT